MCLWGWFLACIGGLCVALGMAELTSAMPTSGGMYYWIHKLSGPKLGPVLCWTIGETGVGARRGKGTATAQLGNWEGHLAGLPMPEPV